MKPDNLPPRGGKAAVLRFRILADFQTPPSSCLYVPPRGIPDAVPRFHPLLNILTQL
jgi:hypothetical protein